MTAEESARTFTRPSEFGRVRVAPQTTYGVARLQQEFGPAGSTTALMATAVHRDLDDGTPLASLLTRNAFTLSTDSLVRLRDGDYEVQVSAGVTHVDGDAAAIDRVQRASARYLQRPDADYTSYDPSRTSMSGAKLIAGIERRNGRHWLWQIGTDIESPEFETNDIGRLSGGDGVVGQGRIEYRETAPSRLWRSYSLALSTRNEWNFGGDLQQGRVIPSVRVTWPNFWESRLEGRFNVRHQDYRLTRGGPSMEQPGDWQANLVVQNSAASQTRGETSLTYGRNDDGGLIFNANAQLTVQPGPRWQLSIRPEYERGIDTQQYVTTLAGGGPATFGRRYVFAEVDRSTYSTQVRLNYTFKPDLTLDFYGEPFAASGRFEQVGELAAARTRMRRLYGTEGTTVTALADGSKRVTDGATSFALANRDFNVESFRSSVVLRWEWRAGSTLYLVWQQDRALEETASEAASFGDMFSSLGRRGDHYFAVKTSFWFSPS